MSDELQCDQADAETPALIVFVFVFVFQMSCNMTRLTPLLPATPRPVNVSWLRDTMQIYLIYYKIKKINKIYK